MDNHNRTWAHALTDSKHSLERFLKNPGQLQKCVTFSDLLTSRIRQGGRIFIFGNGGSHFDAMHFAMQMTGRFRKDRRPMGSFALGDPSHVTCVANDYGFDSIFSRQVQSLASSTDVLIA